jgi:hypothetical protein
LRLIKLQTAGMTWSQGTPQNETEVSGQLHASDALTSGGTDTGAHRTEGLAGPRAGPEAVNSSKKISVPA